MIRNTILAATLSLVSAVALAEDSGKLAEDTTLYQGPGYQALDDLREGTLLSVGERRGGWYQVTLTDGREGYVRLATVRFTEQEESESVFGGLWSWLNSSSSPQYSGTTTAGIRGLSAEDIQQAEPNEAAVDRLDAWAVDEAEARRFASAVALSSQSVDELDD